MGKKIPKNDARKIIEDFFKNIKLKCPKEIKKIKRFAMKHNLPLKNNKKLFCKKCFMPYNTPKIRIKKGKKSVTCSECLYVSRWKIK